MPSRRNIIVASAMCARSLEISIMEYHDILAFLRFSSQYQRNYLQREELFVIRLNCYVVRHIAKVKA